MTRPYRLGKRAVQAAETRQRIIDAARELIVEAGVHDTSLDAVARRAASTRTTVYHQFGSREELLLAVLNEALDRADVREVRKALQHRDATQAMRRMIKASCRFWAGERALFAQVKGLALIDEAMASVDANKEGVRRGHMTNLVHVSPSRGGCALAVPNGRRWIRCCSSRASRRSTNCTGGAAFPSMQRRRCWWILPRGRC